MCLPKTTRKDAPPQVQRNPEYPLNQRGTRAPHHSSSGTIEPMLQLKRNPEFLNRTQRGMLNSYCTSVRSPNALLQLESIPKYSPHNSKGTLFRSTTLLEPQVPVTTLEESQDFHHILKGTSSFPLQFERNPTLPATTRLEHQVPCFNSKRNP